MTRKPRTSVRLILVALMLANCAASGIARAADPPSDEELADKVKQTEESVTAMQSILTRLQRTQIGGYVQARAFYSENAVPSSNLWVRRARLNVKNSWDRGQLVLSFDGGTNVVTAKDAYIDWTMVKGEGQRHGLVIRGGQFFRPFGFELERSDSAREFLERPPTYDVLFPGNRDQGFDLSYGITSALVINGAILNGSGTSTTNLSFRDADDRKDLAARLRYSFFGPRADIALSYYDGEQVIPAVAAVPAVRGFADSNNNGVQDAGEDTVIVSPAKAGVSAITGSRDRWGVSLNFYDLLGGTLRGEYVGAIDLTTNLASGPRQAEAEVRTWFAQYVHVLPHDFLVGVRYDALDPDVDDTVRLGGDGEQTDLGVVFARTVGDNLTLSLLWEHQQVNVYDRTAMTTTETSNDPVTFQMQYAF
ncbi:MAG TPA: hypothetical protein VF720_15050 [Candidatus Eisenbacteria bacterium]